MATFKEYINALKNKNISQVILVQLLNELETEVVPIWIDAYESSGAININMQNGIRRSFTLVLHNVDKKYNIDIDKIWIYQKVKISTGIQFISKDGEVETFLTPQGVYYITNPQSVYNPSSKTITFECIDKFGRLNGRLGGKLDGTYSFPKNYTDAQGNKHKYEYDMFDIVRNLLKTPLRTDLRTIAFMPKVTGQQVSKQINDFLTNNSFNIGYIKNGECVTISDSGDIYYCSNTPSPSSSNFIAPIWSKFNKDNSRILDNIEPLLNEWFYSDDVLGNQRVLLPYSLSKDTNENYGSIILEIAEILGASVYYDRTGRFILEPTQEDSGFLLDNQKEVVWEFNEDNSILYDIPTESYDFENIGNQIVAKGTIGGEGSYTVAVQNTDILSPTNVDLIGVKTFSYDNLGVYSYQDFMEKLNMTKEEAIDKCKKLLKDQATYLLKKKTIMATRVSIRCMPLPHLDVDQVITITKRDESRKKYLITNITLPLNPKEPMTIEANGVFETQKGNGDNVMLGLQSSQEGEGETSGLQE